jgi:TonB family protein
VAKDKNHIDPINEPSLEQMKAYVEGNLSGTEQYQVEKYLLDHPFEAEAMEGYLENPASFNDIDKLNARLKSRVHPEKEKSIIPLWRKLLPYAAVFLLLIISTVFTINFFQQEKSFAAIAIQSDDALQYEKEDSPLNPPLVHKTDAADLQANKSAPKIAQSINSVDEEENEIESYAGIEVEPLSEKAPISPAENLPIADLEDSELVELDDNVLDALQGKVEGFEVAQTKPQVREAEKSSFVARSKASVIGNEDAISSKKSVTKATISGEVIDAETGEPLPGVNIIVKGSATATNTDLEGVFEIAATINDVLIISFIGMEKQEFLVEVESDISIELSSDVAQLSEVVVTGYGTEKGEDNTYLAAKPEIGFSAYKDYLEEQLQYPEKAKEAGTEGRVRLKLYIDAAGNIEEVEVLKSLGDGCDEEAIRLIKEGPKWQAAKKGDSSVASTRKITVGFKIQ